MKNTADPSPTPDTLDDAGIPVADRPCALHVIGTELSMNGLNQIASLLVRLGRSNEKPSEPHSGKVDSESR